MNLNYLFACSTQLDILKRKAKLVEKYDYPVFAEKLGKFNIHPIPSTQDIIEQIKRREMFTLICLIRVLPLISMDREESKTNDLKQFADKEIAVRKTLVGMSSRRFIESMKYTLVSIEQILDKALNSYPSILWKIVFINVRF